MKFLIVLFLLVLAVEALSQEVNGLDSSTPNEGNSTELKKSDTFLNLQLKADGKAKFFGSDPCNYNPFDYLGCSLACAFVGYFNGGYCSGYDCFCFL